MHRYYAVIDAQLPLSENTLQQGLRLSEHQNLFLEAREILRVEAPTCAYVNAVTLQVVVNNPG